MPAALQVTKLAEVQPTQDEVDRARKLRADASAGKKRSIDAGFREYVKKNADLNGDASSAELKELCIQNFVILQLRAKGGQKTLTGTHQASLNSERVTQKHWWNEYQMDTQIGEAQAKHWRESGLIISKPDPVTGSTDPAHIVWGVPKMWESMTEADWKALRLETQRDAKEGDEEAVAELSGLSRSSLGDGSEAKEPVGKTPEEIQTAFHAEIQKQPSTFLRKYMDLKADCMVLHSKTEPDKGKSKFSQMLSDDVAAMLVRFDKLNKSIEGMMKREAKPKEIAKIAKDMTELDADWDDLVKMAQNFGYDVGAKPKTKRARK